MVNIKLISMDNKFNDLPYLQIIQNHTICQCAYETCIDFEKLIKYLKEFKIIDEYHYPYENFEYWFEVRLIPGLPKYSLAVTPKGELKLIEFCKWLRKKNGINIFLMR